ncbi:MAG: PAS domain-containing protein [Alphaproteobacteria bacterium]|nr:PAS domain-containing protein [Alphaproteobacteria bacterium]
MAKVKPQGMEPKPPRKPRSRRTAFYVVGIGASAGGLEALRPLVANLPESGGMAYVIIQHLAPQYRSMMVQLLGRETTLPVEEIKDGTVIAPNTIYITPPNKDVTARNGTLWLREPSAPMGPKPSVDVFFASLAQDRGRHAIGVILSGTGTDGTHGVRAIKAGEGLTIAQDPETAKYDGMPKAALDTNCVDLVLPPERIGPELASITRFPRPVVQKTEESETRDTINEIFQRVRQRTDIDFTHYKSNTVSRRLERRLAANRIDNLPAYLDFVQRNPTELDLLCKDILISVTSFFRDTKAFEDVKASLAELLATKKPGDSIRIWVPACATGEEPYSFAMMLSDTLGDAVRSFRIQIFATDIDMDAMAHARKGIYSATTVENLDKDYIEKYFDVMGHSCQIKKTIREMVVFARQDLIKDPPFVKVDLVSCRNVLIYFNGEVQNKVFQIFHYALNPDGYLFLGKSEAVGHCSDLFRPVKAASKIFQKRLVSPRSTNPVFGAFRPRIAEAMDQNSAPPGGPSIESMVRDAFVEAYMPPSVAINDELDILFYHGDVDLFVRFPQGRPNQNLAKLIAEDLRIDLRALVHRARERGVPVLGGKKQLRTRDGDIFVRLAVRPLRVENRRENLFLVSCEKVELPVDPIARDAEPQPSGEARMVELEQELIATREHLQTVVEELETSNEELQALNEEMQAANEELQSSNEELETSNEELQSTNEELTTVNEELQVRTTELAAANADLQNLQDTVGFPLLVVDRTLRITRFTPQAVRLFGLLPTDLGQLITAVATQLHIKDLRAIVLGVMARGQMHQDVIEADGRIYLMRVVPYRDLRDQIAGAILNFLDETEIRSSQRELVASVQGLQAAEEELRDAKEFAETANRSKSAFLANMSHELRTPLNAILGFGQMMESEMYGPLGHAKYQEYSKIILDSGQHLLALINQVLDLSKIEAGKHHLHEETFELVDAISGSMLLLANQAERRKVTVTSEIQPGLPQLYADRTSVQRVLLNLIGNAIKFTPAGGHVKVKAITGSAGLILSVADTGCGIKTTDLARVMRPFEQGGMSGTHDGVGLGLPISKSLVELHGGTLDLQSEEGKGTIAFAVFPTARLRPLAAPKA